MLHDPTLPSGEGAGNQSCLNHTSLQRKPQCDDAAVNRQDSSTQTTSVSCDKTASINLLCNNYDRQMCETGALKVNGGMRLSMALFFHGL